MPRLRIDRLHGVDHRDDFFQIGPGRFGAIGIKVQACEIGQMWKIYGGFGFAHVFSQLGVRGGQV